MQRIIAEASNGVSARTGRPKKEFLPGEQNSGKLITADKKKVEILNNTFAPIFSRNIQGQLGENSEQTELAKNVPAHYWVLVPAEL